MLWHWVQWLFVYQLLPLVEKQPNSNALKYHVVCDYKLPDFHRFSEALFTWDVFLYKSSYCRCKRWLYKFLQTIIVAYNYLALLVVKKVYKKGNVLFENITWSEKEAVLELRHRSPKDERHTQQIKSTYRRHAADTSNDIDMTLIWSTCRSHY